MAFNGKEQPILSVGPIIGLDATSDPSTVDAQHATVLQNIMPQREPGAYVTAQGRTQFAPALPAAMESDPLKFYTSPTAFQYLAFCADGNIYRFAGNVAASLVSAGYNANTNAKFVAAQNWAFFSDANSKTIKIDQNFNVTNWGINAPVAAPTIAPGITTQTLAGTNTGTPSTTTASSLVTLNAASATGKIAVSCRLIRQGNPNYPDTWTYSYSCFTGSSTPAQWSVLAAAPIAVGSQLTFTAPTITGGSQGNLQLISPSGAVLQTWNDIGAGTTYAYSNAAAVAGTYTWKLLPDVSGVTGSQDYSTSGTYQVTTAPTITYYSQGGLNGITNGTATQLVCSASVAPISAQTAISVAFSNIVVPSDANGTSNYVAVLTDATGFVWFTQNNITTNQTVTWYDTTGAAQSGDYTWTIYATVTLGGGGGASTYNCSCNLLASWEQIVTGGLTAGGAYAYIVTFGNAVQESSASPLTPFLTLNATNGSAIISLTGTTFIAGSKLTVTFAPNQANQASGVFTYTVVSGDTLSSIAAGLAAAINEAIAQQGNKNISLPQGGASSDSNGNVTFYNTGTNPLPYSGSVVNGATGDIAISPTNVTNCPPASFQTAISLSAIPVSTDPQVTVRNLYRIGGSQAQFELVATLNDNTTTTYVDTLADLSITGQTLVPHRDPPQPFLDIVFYQDRVWGLGYSSSSPYTLEQAWYSLYRQPWGFDNTNQVLVVGENPGNDPIVGGAALPNMLLVLKRQSAWGITGSSQVDYLPIPLFGIGCVSKKSIKTAYGIVFWLSPDGVVFMFDGGSVPQDISTITQSKCSIKGVLDTLTQADLAAAVGFFHQSTYYLSFPTKGYTFGYYLPTQAWFQLMWAADAACFDIASKEVIAGSGTAVSQWFQAETDLGNPITATLTTGYGFDPSGGASAARHLILSSIGSANVNANITVTAYYAQTSASNVQTVSLASSRQTRSLPPNLVGQAFQMSVSTTSSAKTNINNLTLFAYPKRALNVKG